jgi:hypothetical protein
MGLWISSYRLQLLLDHELHVSNLMDVSVSYTKRLFGTVWLLVNQLKVSKPPLKDRLWHKGLFRTHRSSTFNKSRSSLSSFLLWFRSAFHPGDRLNSFIRFFG